MEKAMRSALLLTLLLAFVQWRGSMAQWTSATATFYGGADASGTMGQYNFFPFFTKTKNHQFIYIYDAHAKVFFSDNIMQVEHVAMVTCTMPATVL